MSVPVTTTQNQNLKWRCTTLANIKSAKKKSIRSAVKTSIKKVEVAVKNNDKAAAQTALTEAIATISKATSKGVYHKNNCARKVSRLTKAVNSIG